MPRKPSGVRALKNWIKQTAKAAGYEIRKSLPSDATDFPGRVHSVVHDGHSVRFFVNSEFDYIQRHHGAGRIYEPEELSIISRHCPRGGVFVDVGANVGNHAIYLARALGLRRVIAFEPGRTQNVLLRVNIALNELEDVVTAMRTALSDRDGAGTLVCDAAYNLGSAHLADDREGEVVRIMSGDVALDGVVPDFLKIDVEGHELQVLRGLSNTIRSARPPIFIEVQAEGSNETLRWLSENGYGVVEVFTRYWGQSNLMCVHGVGSNPCSTRIAEGAT